MAYNFSQTMRLMGDQDQGQSNIFGGSGQQQTGTGGASPGASVPKTSTEGSLGGVGSPPSGSGSIGGSNAVAGQQVMRNAPNPKTYNALLNPTQQGLNRSQQTLKDELGVYRDQNLANVPTINKDVVEKASKDINSEEAKKVQKVMNPGQMVVPQFSPKADYRPPSDTADLSAGTYRNLMTRYAPSRASTGSLNLQENLLKNDPMFQNIKTNLLGDVDAFGKEVAKKTGTGEGSAQSTVQKTVNDQREGSARIARELMRNMQNQIASRGAETQRRIEQATNDLRSRASTVEQDYINRLAKERPDLAPYLDPNFIDESKSVIPGGLINEKGSFLSLEDAAAFNNIMTLLGEGGQSVTGGGYRDPRLNEVNLQQSILQDALRRYSEAQTAAEAQQAAAAPASRSPQRSSPVIVAPPNPVQEVLSDPLKAVRAGAENAKNLSDKLPGPFGPSRGMWRN